MNKEEETSFAFESIFEDRREKEENVSVLPVTNEGENKFHSDARVIEKGGRANQSTILSTKCDEVLHNCAIQR